MHSHVGKDGKHYWVEAYMESDFNNCIKSHPCNAKDCRQTKIPKLSLSGCAYPLVSADVLEGRRGVVVGV